LQNLQLSDAWDRNLNSFKLKEESEGLYISVGAGDAAAFPSKNFFCKID